MPDGFTLYALRAVPLYKHYPMKVPKFTINKVTFRFFSDPTFSNSPLPITLTTALSEVSRRVERELPELLLLLHCRQYTVFLKNKRPNWCHLLFYLTSYVLNTDTTPTEPHRNSNTHRIKNNTTNVVIQQNSRKFLMVDLLMSETCWAHKKWNKIASDIKLVFYSSTVTMMHGPINIRHCTLSRTSISRRVLSCLVFANKRRIFTKYFKIQYLLSCNSSILT